MLDTVGKRKCVVRACAKTWIITAWCNWGKMGGRLHKVGKECTCWATWWKHVTLKKNNRRQQRVAEIEKSWKSYTCFSPDYLKKKKKKTRMWANAQRDGRPAEYRWRRLFIAAKFGWSPPLTPCSNAATMRNPLKFTGMSQAPEPITAVSGPKFAILWDVWRR